MFHFLIHVYSYGGLDITYVGAPLFFGQDKILINRIECKNGYFNHGKAEGLSDLLPC